MRRFTSPFPRTALLTLGLALAGCGGSGGGGTTPGPTGPPDFVAFFADVHATSAQGTEPVEVSGIAFQNQFPTDPTTFDFLLP
jgi:hypothetical protein